MSSRCFTKLVIMIELSRRGVNSGLFYEKFHPEFQLSQLLPNGVFDFLNGQFVQAFAYAAVLTALAAAGTAIHFGRYNFMLIANWGPVKPV